MKKILDSICVALAFVCIAIGTIGIVLPLLPTTPFLLLALMLFAKGSKRFHKWFMGTLLYKKYLETYVSTKTMSLHTKRNVLITVSILFTFGFIFSPVLWARIVIVVVWIGHFYFFLFRIKTNKNELNEIQNQNVTNKEDKNKPQTDKKRGRLKKFLSCFLIVGFLVYMLCGGWSNENMKSLPLAKAKTETGLADGTYVIPVSLWHATNNAASMGNGALHQTGKLVIKEKEATLHLYLLRFSLYGLTGNLMQLNLLENITLNEYNYPTSYDLLNSTIISTYATVDSYNAPDSTDSVSVGKFYPKVVSVPVTIDTEYTWAHVYVPVMGSLGFGDQMCRIKLDYTSAQLMSEEQLQEWTAYETTDTQDPDEDPDGEDTTKVDKSTLKGKLDTANALLIQTDIYTEASLSNLNSAITIAQKAYDNTSINQAAIDAQVIALQTAMDALAKKSTEILDKNNLKNGKYNVYIDFWKSTANEASMGNAAVNHTAMITVKDGTYKLEFSTRPMTLGTITACLQSVQIEQLDGTYAIADITAKNNSLNGVAMPSIFSFTLPSKEEYINIKIDPKVEVMGNEPLAARLKISWDTLTSISDDSTVEEDTDTIVVGDDTPAVDLTDKKTKIRIKADANILEKGVSMTVSKISSGTDYDTIKDLLTTIGSEFVAYDIKLLNSSGLEVEPKGMVTVYIPVPEDYSSSTIAVYRIKDEAKIKLVTTIEDEYAIFQTSSFSSFTLVDTSSVTKSTLPTTKKAGTLTKKSTSSSVSAKSSPPTGVSSVGQITENQNIEDGLVVEDLAKGQMQKVGSSLQMNQMLTLVMFGTAMIGSILIMLFLIGFILINSSLRRKK